VRVHQSFEIARPPEVVFAFITDPDRLGQWQTSIVEIRRERREPPAPGERFREVHAGLGRRLESTVEVVEYDAPRRFALRIVDGPLPLDGAWTLTPSAGGTRVEFAGDGRLRGARRLLEPLVNALVRRQFRAHHERLRRALEG
jgi:uncharacterized protein YndB with AHSA1/START domain